MFQKSTSFFLIFLLFFSGCSNPFSDPKLEETTPILPTVKVEMIKRTLMGNEISVSGTITPQEEITVASEVMGTVSRVLKKEGDKIRPGELIMKLSSGDNMASVSFASAQRAYISAQKLVDLTVSSGQKQVKNAELSVGRAKILLDRLEKTKTFTFSSQKTQTVSTGSSLSIAQKGLDLAKKSQSDIFINEEKTHLNLLEKMANSVSSSFVSLNAGVNFVDTIFGISSVHKTDNDAYEYNILGNAPASLIMSLKDQLGEITPQILEIKAIHQKNNKTVYTKNDEITIIDSLESTDYLLKEVRALLQNADDILQYSFVNNQFPESQLTGIKSQINGYLQSIEGSISAFSLQKQALMDFSLQSPQRLLDSEIQVSVAENKLISAQQSLISSENIEKSIDISLESEILEAKNSLAQAISNLEMAKVQAGVSEQNAITQLSNALASLDSSSLSLSKLSISSHIGGVVTKVLKKDGDTIQSGTPLLVISNVSALKLVSDVSVEESLHLRTGMPVDIVIDSVSESFTGVLSLIYPEADKVTRRVKVEILLLNSGRVPANTFATAKIKIPTVIPEIYIPITTLVSQNPPTVFTVESQQDGTYRLKKNIIEIGKTVNGFILVKKGLLPNQLLVSEVYPTLFEEDTIIPLMSTPISTITSSPISSPATSEKDLSSEDTMQELWNTKKEL